MQPELTCARGRSIPVLPVAERCEMNDQRDLLNEMNDRSREIFRRVVEGYLASGTPMGSRTLTRSLSEKLSAATIRNVMQDLEYMGLLESPHVSAGRVPTQQGLRLFVDGLLEVDPVSATDRQKLDATRISNDQDLGEMLDRVGQTLSSLTHGASLVLAPKAEAPIKHIEFVALSRERALVVLVFADGQVENRIFTPPAGVPPSAMREAANFLNASLRARRCRTCASGCAPRSSAVGSRSTCWRATWSSGAWRCGRTRARRRSG